MLVFFLVAAVGKMSLDPRTLADLPISEISHDTDGPLLFARVGGVGSTVQNGLTQKLHGFYGIKYYSAEQSICIHCVMSDGLANG